MRPPPRRPTLFTAWTGVSALLHAGVLLGAVALGGRSTLDAPKAQVADLVFVVEAAPPEPAPAEPPSPEVTPPEVTPPPQPEPPAQPEPEVKPLEPKQAPVPHPAAKPAVRAVASHPVAAVAAPADATGSGEPIGAATSGTGVDEDVLAAYAKLLWRRIERTRPKLVSARGTAVATFAVAADGGLVAASITIPSGSDELDSAALRAIRGAAPFPPAPDGATPERLRFTIPFRFQ